MNPKFFSCLMVYRSWGKKSFSDSDMFSWVELDPKFGILAFSAIFVLFFWVAKNLIYIDNAFNGYSYLKSTRKGLSDGTLMLKKEYRLARWNCDWKSYTFPKKYPPARENDQNSTKSTKWLKITFRGSKMVPKVSKWGFWGVFVLKSCLRILIRASEVPFSVPPKHWKWVSLGVFGSPEGREPPPREAVTWSTSRVSTNREHLLSPWNRCSCPTLS